MWTKTEQAETEQRWGIAASAPPVNPAEVESAESAIEVVVMWGDNVLHVEHLSPPRDVLWGETIGDIRARHPVVVEQGGRLCCVIPAGAFGSVTVGELTRDFEQLRDEGKLTPFSELDGASLYALPDGAKAEINHDGLTFLVRPTNAGKAPAGNGQVSWRRYAWIAVSMSVHSLFLAMFYLMPPSTQALSLDTISPTERMVEYLDMAPETTPEEEIAWEQGAGEEAGDPGQAHDGEEGDSGREDAPQTNRRFAIQGDPEDRDPEMARRAIGERMEEIGAIGALATLMGNWNTPTSPYGADQAHGPDAFNAIGELMGASLGDSFGNLGLGMRGSGRGAGGDGQGTIGVGRYGTIGSCRGTRCGHGNGTGYGRSAGRFNGRRGIDVTVPRGVAVVRGGLSREAIRRVVRRNLAQVRHCYEQGLQQNPSLEGRVQVSWIIAPSGAVQGSSVSSSTVRNDRVESCIAQAVRRWTFPAPDGGSLVSVNYPFVLRSH